MRLSEAMMLGSLSTKPGRNLFQYHDGEHLRACALGAAGYAIGTNDYVGVELAFPWITENLEGCPECEISEYAETMIIHLNDAHGWSRERTADWVATVEPKETAEQIVTPTTGPNSREGTQWIAARVES